VGTSVVNRYYDPTTDQFLSIDPDVAATDQPYLFTNDNPLNAEDPMGLKKCVGPAPVTQSEMDGCENYVITGPVLYSPTDSGTAQWSNLFQTAGALSFLVNPFGLFSASSASSEAESGYEIADGSASHMFRDAPGHFADDTAANREAITETANNPENYVGTRNGVSTYRRTLSNGKQIWAEVYRGAITNGGINHAPR
jgi:hypothetical protein